MPGKKKTFSCGHRGKGKYCHRCEQESQATDQLAQAKAEKERRFAESPISLEHLPPALAEKALSIIREIRKGKSYLDYYGKRFVTMGQRDIISIPVGRRYRLVCKDLGGDLEFLEVVSHEAYNNRLSSGGWNK